MHLRRAGAACPTIERGACSWKRGSVRAAHPAQPATSVLCGASSVHTKVRAPMCVRQCASRGDTVSAGSRKPAGSRQTHARSSCRAQHARRAVRAQPLRRPGPRLTGGAVAHVHASDTRRVQRAESGEPFNKKPTPGTRGSGAGVKARWTLSSSRTQATSKPAQDERMRAVAHG